MKESLSPWWEFYCCYCRQGARIDAGTPITSDVAALVLMAKWGWFPTRPFGSLICNRCAEQHPDDVAPTLEQARKPNGYSISIEMDMTDESAAFFRDLMKPPKRLQLDIDNPRHFG